MYLRVVLFLAFCASVWGQVFTLVNADVSGFPTVRAQFIAYDAWGNPYQNLQPSDFSIRENGRSLQATLRVVCQQVAGDTTANVVLVVDRSGSMNEIVDKSTNETRWDWVKAGVQEFLNQFPFKPPSAVALISFGGVAELACPWSTSARPILDSLNKIRPDGSTKYDPPLLDTTIGAIKLLSLKPRTVRRIIIFLTDGQPDVPPQTDTIIARCRREAITFYAITVGLSMNPDLDRIARATGGKSFEVFTKDRLKDIYRLLALEATQRQQCYLEWTAPWSCSEQERIRNVEVTFLRPTPPITSTLQYTAPPQSIAKLEITPQVAYFGNPNPGIPTTVTLTVKATGAPMQVTALPIIPASGYYSIVDMGGRTPPFTLQVGEVWNITVQFIQQGSKQYRQATLTIDGTPCPASVMLIGGLSRALVVSPNGGELFSTCDSVTIRWAGVEPNQPVSVYYALNGNQPNPTWQLIARNVTGYSLRWKPPQAGQNYRIRVVVPPDSGYLWTQQLGGSDFDTCRSIVIDSRYQYLYITGTYAGTATVNGTTLTSMGESDVFVACFDTDGNVIWARSGGGPRSEQGCCVAIDNNNYLYVAGVFRSNTIQFGGITASKSNSLDVSNAFIARYNSSGNPISVVVGGGGATGSCEIRVDSIAFAGGSIYLTGWFKGRLQFSSTPTRSINSANANQFDRFTAVFDNALNVVNLQRGYLAAPYTKAVVRDTSGNRYETGGFSGTFQSGSTRLTSRGSWDVYVRKFGIIPGSEDVSDTTFRVQSPLIRIRSASLDVGSVAVGESIGQVFSGQLCNDGEIPVIITSMNLTGAQAGEFRIVSNYVNYVLKPGECLSLELLFTPAAEGVRTAQLVVQGNCGAPAQASVQGTGLPPCKYTITAPPTLSTSVGIARQLTGHCLLRNTGNQPISGTLKFVNDPTNAFTARVPATNCTVDAATGCPFTVDPGQCLVVDIEYLPSATGTHTAQFVIELPSKCGGTQQQNVTGNALPSQVELEVPQFGAHRVLTTTTLTARIKNTSANLDAVVRDIRLRDAANPHFRLANLPQTPFILQAGQERTFDVVFTPQAEGDLSEVIEAIVDGLPGPVAARTTGTGTLPKIDAPEVTFSPWPVGSTSPQVLALVIRNTSTTAPLVVKSIGQPDNASFFFDAPLPALPATIAIGDSLAIPVRFRPAQVGTNTARVTITSDAAPGPDTDPSTTTTVQLSGVGLSLSISTPQDFGDVLLCESVVSRTITISNPGPEEESFSISASGDTAPFTIRTSSTTIPPGGTATVTIDYTPTPGRQTLVLEISSPALAEPVRITLTANGVARPLRIEVGSESIDVGQRKDVTVRFTTTADAGKFVQRLRLQLDYDKTSIDVDAASFQPQQNGWTWQLQSLPSGALLDGSSTTGLLNGTLDVRVPFAAFITATTLHPIVPTLLNASEYPCLQVEPVTGHITTPYYCAQEVRQVKIVEPTQLMMQQTSSGDILITARIGEDIPYTLHLVSVLGSEVLRLAEGSCKGTVNASIPAGSVPSGLYFVRLLTPLGAIVQSIIVSR